MYQMVGYLSREEDYVFLAPIYEQSGRLYMHALSADERKIQGFQPFRREEYDNPGRYRPFNKPQPVEVTQGSDVPMLFKAEGAILVGTVADDSFIKTLRSKEEIIRRRDPMVANQVRNVLRSAVRLP